MDFDLAWNLCDVSVEVSVEVGVAYGMGEGAEEEEEVDLAAKGKGKSKRGSDGVDRNIHRSLTIVVGWGLHTMPKGKW